MRSSSDFKDPDADVCVRSVPVTIIHPARIEIIKEEKSVSGVVDKEKV